MRAPDENQLASQLGWLPEFDPAFIYDVAVVGAGRLDWRRPCTRRPRVVGGGIRLPRAGRQAARVRGSKTIRLSTGIPVRHWPDARSCRRRSSARTSPFRRRSSASLRLHADPDRAVERAARELAYVVIATARLTGGRTLPGSKNSKDAARITGRRRRAKLCKGSEVVLVAAAIRRASLVYLASHAARVHLLIRAGLELSMSSNLIDRIAAFRT